MAASVTLLLLAGVKSNGELKLRAIDDFTRSSVNAHTRAGEKLKCDTLDAYFLLLKELSQQTAEISIQMWKADVDSAYRRVPVQPSHYEFAGITFKFRGVPLFSLHRTLPFGAVASVHGWDRIGASLMRRFSCPLCSLVSSY